MAMGLLAGGVGSADLGFARSGLLPDAVDARPGAGLTGVLKGPF